MHRLDDSTPHARLLSNGRYIVLLTGAGTGYSAWAGHALTAWSADRTEDGDGFFVYLRDLDRGTLWSVGHQPIAKPADRYAARYHLGTVTIVRVDDEIEARLDACVVPDDDVEIRRVRLQNLGSQARYIELTSYAEIVLHDRGAHAAHPAFSKLFVQTEYVGGAECLVARRRPRSPGERVAWMGHALVGPGRLEYDTDRAGFLGRGHTPAWPRALASAAPLGRSVGNVLDPIISLRRAVRLAAGESAHFTLLLAAAGTREAVLAQLAGRRRRIDVRSGCGVGATPAWSARRDGGAGGSVSGARR